MGIRIGLNRWLNQLVPGYEHSPTRFSHGQTIFQNELQEDQEVGPDGNKLLRIAWCVEFAGMFDSIQCLPYRQRSRK